MFQAGSKWLHSQKILYNLCMALSVRGLLNESPFKQSVMFVSKARSLLVPYFKSYEEKYLGMCLYS